VGRVWVGFAGEFVAGSNVAARTAVFSKCTRIPWLDRFIMSSTSQGNIAPVTCPSGKSFLGFNPHDPVSWPRRSPPIPVRETDLSRYFRHVSVWRWGSPVMSISTLLPRFGTRFWLRCCCWRRRADGFPVCPAEADCWSRVGSSAREGFAIMSSSRRFPPTRFLTSSARSLNRHASGRDCSRPLGFKLRQTGFSRSLGGNATSPRHESNACG
jgi:hypothetical protein